MNTPLFRFAILISVALFACSCGSSSEEPIPHPALDQFFDPIAGPSTEIAIGLSDQRAQTFTVGVTGTLDFVELYVGQGFPGAALSLDVRPTSGGRPVESDLLALATLTLPDGTLSGTAGFFTFDLRGAAVAVTAGEELAITLRAVGGNGLYAWGADTLTGYDAGSAFTRSPPGFWNEIVGADFLFRTYVTPTL